MVELKTESEKAFSNVKQKVTRLEHLKLVLRFIKRFKPV